jgi:hypothetical protein
LILLKKTSLSAAKLPILTDRQVHSTTNCRGKEENAALIINVAQIISGRKKSHVFPPQNKIIKKMAENRGARFD